MIGVIFLIIVVVVGVMVLVFRPTEGSKTSNGDGIKNVRNFLINRTTFAMAFTLLYFFLDYLLSGPVLLVAFILGYGSGETAMNTAYFIIFASMTFLIRLMVPSSWFQRSLNENDLND